MRICNFVPFVVRCQIFIIPPPLTKTTTIGTCRYCLLSLTSCRSGIFFTPKYFRLKIFSLPYIFNRNIIASRTPGKAGNTGHGPEYHKPPPVDVPHKYRARQAASLWERESTRRQGRGNEVGPGEGAPARMAVCDTAGRKAAGGGDESAARVDASCEQPVKPRRFLTSHQPGAIQAGNEAGKWLFLMTILCVCEKINPHHEKEARYVRQSRCCRVYRAAVP